MNAGSLVTLSGAGSRAAIALALAVCLVGCGGGREDAAAVGSEPEATPAAAEEIPERDVSAIDVCAELPAEVLAEAAGMPVAEAPSRLSNDPSPNCSYRLLGPSGGAERVDVFLKEPFDYDWARETAESFGREILTIDDLGLSAYMKQSPDFWWEVWVRRQDGVVVETTAQEQEPALAAARAAVDRIP